ncbi:hypothetical protein OYE22_22965 [Streptomyces sp. 71268]|uniref:hypothetical protein n=1 Tax=Streptomyces sp. 71268 TaxID=3002640 RepID=UPI0023F6673A|nr:hypothetical protein [Streptomyces sp. 71268]WEV27723.1 hypothetical protein OYE22_22965 [Streptomyces sp. 71268]
MSHSEMNRRKVVTTAVGATALATITTAGLAPTPAFAVPVALKDDGRKEALRKLEARRRRILTGRNSANGWEMENVVDDGGSIWTQPIAGTGLSLAVRAGDVATVLVHAVRRFHYQVNELGVRGEEPAVRGWVHPSNARDSQLPESNQASGTAVVIRPSWYMAGMQDAFSPHEVLAIHDIAADCEGIVRWGGDDRRPHPGLFYLNVRPGDAKLAHVANKIRSWNETPGQGAGVLRDPTLRRHARHVQ